MKAAAVFRVVVSGLALLLVAMHCGTCACNIAFPSTKLEERALLRGLERRIDDGEYKNMRGIFPEGGLFTLSFTGFALVSMAIERGDDDAFRAHARDEVKHLLELSEGERDVPPFSSWKGRDPNWRGVILEGHQNLLRAGYVILGGDDVDVIRDFHATSEKLAAKFAQAPSGAIESFWRRTWYVDNAVALESLRVHDDVYGTDYGRDAAERFRRKVRAHVDARSGMPASEISLDDARVLDGPRGCALSWLLAFQPDVVAGAAHGSLWQRYKRDWGVDEFGMLGFREYPPWRKGRMDVDSGPIIDGIGGAASAFGVAAARANHDGDALARMELPLTILTFPAATFHGDEELFAGQLPLADALSLWGRTWQPWPAPWDANRLHVDRVPPPLLPALLAFVLAMIPVLLAALVFWRAVRNLRKLTAWPSTTTATTATTPATKA